MMTIYDAARRAGVTAATVSNVVTGKGKVGKETRARVLAALAEVDYRPNLLARGLARRRSFTLALLLSTIADPVYPEIALEVERIARERGYHLLLCNTHDDTGLGRAHLKSLSGRLVDGILAMAGSLDLGDVVTANERGLPLVVCTWCDRADEHHDVALPSIDVDVREGGELAARHLLDLGHERFGVIMTENVAHQPSHTRILEGFCDALGRQGILLTEGCIAYADETMEGGYRAAEHLVMQPHCPTAIFATTDTMALGALQALIDRGLRVPADISLVGFDDIALSAHVRPTLTTIAIPKRDLARTAMELLLRLVEGSAVEGQPHAPHIAIYPSLVVRHSTASARGSPAAPALAAPTAMGQKGGVQPGTSR